jgi:hypothetical protein
VRAPWPAGLAIIIISALIVMSVRLLWATSSLIGRSSGWFVSARLWKRERERATGIQRGACTINNAARSVFLAVMFFLLGTIRHCYCFLRRQDVVGVQNVLHAFVFEFH